MPQRYANNIGYRCTKNLRPISAESVNIILGVKSAQIELTGLD